MQQKSMGSQIWRFAGPLIIQYLISLFVSMCASTYMVWKHLPELMKLASKSGDMTPLMTSIMTDIMKYTTEITTIGAMITIPIMLFMFRRDRKMEMKQQEQLPKKVKEKAKAVQYLPIVLLGVVACVALNNLLTLSNIVFLSDTYEATAEGFYSAKFIIQIIGLGFITPIAEELVFRGLIYKRFRETFPMIRAIIWSAMIFGLYHGNLVQALYGLILGLLLAYIYEKYGSIKAPILAHIVLNLTSVILSKLNVFTWIFETPIKMGIVTVVCAGLAATMFVLIQKIDMGSNDEENENLTVT